VPLLLFLRAHGLLPLSAAGALVVVAPLATAVAAVSWYAVEKPLQERARRATTLARRPAAARRRPAVAPGASRAG
jgi:peptidoglycan/LPS O-acetylase OafA/YrhL